MKYNNNLLESNRSNNDEMVSDQQSLFGSDDNKKNVK